MLFNCIAKNLEQQDIQRIFFQCNLQVHCSIFQSNTQRFVSFVALKAIDQKFLSKSTENVLLQKPLAHGSGVRLNVVSDLLLERTRD